MITARYLSARLLWSLGARSLGRPRDRPDRTMMVYVLTMTAVYDHGCCGVFSDRISAEAHANALHAASDGHHGFRIDEMQMDAPIIAGLRLQQWTGDRKPQHPTTTPDFVPWSSRPDPNAPPHPTEPPADDPDQTWYCYPDRVGHPTEACSPTNQIHDPDYCGWYGGTAR